MRTEQLVNKRPPLGIVFAISIKITSVKIFMNTYESTVDGSVSIHLPLPPHSDMICRGGLSEATKQQQVTFLLSTLL